MNAAFHAPLLATGLGHVAGIIAFTAFLVLLFRGARMAGHPRFSATAAAAILSLLWNLGSLVVLVADEGAPGRDAVAALSLAVFSMLPSVLLHLALGSEYRWLRVTGYITGCISASLHGGEALGTSIATHQMGIDLTTYGFGGLAVALVVVSLHRGAGRGHEAMRASVAISLFLLAASFVHFGDEPGAASWPLELIVHHAAIPLALLILVQDHRFLLLDAFIRWLGSALLAAAFSTALLFALLLSGWLRFDSVDARGLVVLIAGTSSVVLLYPLLREWIRAAVEPLLFQRPDIETPLDRLESLEDRNDSPAVEQAATVISDYLAVQHWELSGAEEALPDFGVEVLGDRGLPRRRGSRPWAAVRAVLRTSPGRCRVLWLGPRKGGQRYLGADLENLNRLASAAAVRLETLRRHEQLRILAEANLQTLRAQINPHFLFNALNALYGAIPRNVRGARQTLLNLADILRYSLEGKHRFVALEEELRVVEAYLSIERLRLQERLSVDIQCEESARKASIPAFTIQPLVENAVKHGIGGRPEGGTVRLEVRLVDAQLWVQVADDGVGFEPDEARREGHGLPNVRRRLEICYGDPALLQVTSGDQGATVSFRVPAFPEEE